MRPDEFIIFIIRLEFPSKPGAPLEYDEGRARILMTETRL